MALHPYQLNVLALTTMGLETCNYYALLSLPPITIELYNFGSKRAISSAKIGPGLAPSEPAPKYNLDLPMCLRSTRHAHIYPI